MNTQRELTGKQAKSIIQHILHHIEDYVVDPSVSLTNQDLRDYQGKLVDIIQRVRSSSVQRRATEKYEFVTRILTIRYRVREEANRVRALSRSQ
jgi:hypothetical protein